MSRTCVTKRKALHPTDDDGRGPMTMAGSCDDDGRGPMTMAGSCVTAAALTKTYIHETTTTTEHGETERSGAGRRSGAERSGAGRRSGAERSGDINGSRKHFTSVRARAYLGSSHVWARSRPCDVGLNVRGSQWTHEPQRHVTLYQKTSLSPRDTERRRAGTQNR